MDWRYERLVILGALLLQVVGTFLVSGLSLTNVAFAAPLLMPAVILGALAVAKGKPWQYLGAGIALAVLPLLLLAFVPASIVTPQLGIIYVGAVMLLFSLVVGLVAGVRAFRARKSTETPASFRAAIRTRQGLASVLLAGMMLGAILAGASAYSSAITATSSQSADLRAGVNVTLVAQNYAFLPYNLSFPSGQLVAITVVNKDSDFHTVTYTVGAGTPQEVTYNHDLLPGQTITFTTLVASPGVVPFWCVPHRTMGMVGNFVVS